MGILKDLSQGSLDEGRLGDLIMQHNNVFRHAMRFPHVQAVVYCTRSLHEAENENIVTQGIEFVNMVQQKKTPFRIAPPVLLLLDHEIEKENPLIGKFLKYLPGPSMSACFLATVTREVCMFLLLMIVRIALKLLHLPKLNSNIKTIAILVLNIFGTTCIGSDMT